jgi:hypothetical protein
MRTLHASLPPVEENTRAMPTLENDDELTLSYRKMLLPLALGIIRCGVMLPQFLLRGPCF